MKPLRRFEKPRPDVPSRCKCMGGTNRAREHAKPGKMTADHGDPYGRSGRIPPCIHSQLQFTTAPRRSSKRVPILEFVPV